MKRVAGFLLAVAGVVGAVVAIAAADPTVNGVAIILSALALGTGLFLTLVGEPDRR